ncbi:MAG: hypothetical protein FWF10_09620 [Clostridiales bacterium]|nr:hypothetical protein [Clostridiales bacterium]
MSSCIYTAAQLEEMRKETLRKSILLRIETTKKQMEGIKKHLEGTSENAVFGAESFSNIAITVTQSDDGLSGVEKASVSTAAFAGGTQRLSALDFSSMLNSLSVNNNPLSNQFAALLARIDERPILRKEDRRDRERLIEGIHTMMLDRTADIEDGFHYAKARILSYLASGSRGAAGDVKRFEALRLEYRALCALLSETEKPLLLDELESSVPKMKAALLKQQEDEEVIRLVEESMAAAGFRTQGSCVLEKREGTLYASDNSPLCDVFVAQDGGSFLFETIARSGEDSLDRRYRVEENARQICSQYKQLEAEAAKRGVVLSCLYSVQPKYEEITSEARVVASQETRRRRQRQTRERHLEE